MKTKRNATTGPRTTHLSCVNRSHNKLRYPQQMNERTEFLRYIYHHVPYSFALWFDEKKKATTTTKE
jgi:hypothetical protein